MDQDIHGPLDRYFKILNRPTLQFHHRKPADGMHGSVPTQAVIEIGNHFQSNAQLTNLQFELLDQDEIDGGREEQFIDERDLIRERYPELRGVGTRSPHEIHTHGSQVEGYV